MPALAAAAAAATQPTSGQTDESTRARPTVRLESPDGAEWPEALDAIAFELDQAGYIVVRGEDPSATETIIVERMDARWRLRCAREQGPAKEQFGQVAEGPTYVAMLAVELLLATRTQPMDSDEIAEPEPVERPTPEPAKDVVVPPIDGARDTGSLRATRTWHHNPRRWAAELGANASSIGSIGSLGLELGLVRLWTRTEVGLVLGAGSLAGSEEDTSVNGDSSSVEMYSIAKARLAVTYVSRPGRRVRPSAGVASGFAVPFVSSTATRVNLHDGSRLDSRTADAGLLWMPSAVGGLRVGIQPGLAWQLTARVGPVLTLRRPELAAGGRFDFSDWFAGATMGLVFGSKRPDPAK